MKGGNIRVGNKIQIPETLTTTTDSDLLYMCQKLNIPIVNNKVYMNNEFNIEGPLKDGNYIINLDDLYQKGTHWVALIKDRNVIYYFDSFATAPFFEFTHIKEYKFIFNSRQLQSLDSDSCGYWVILWLNAMHKKPSQSKYITFIKPFSATDQETVNEPLLKKKIKNLFSRYSIR